ncbi:MAG: hypothetical protein PHD37_03285 [Gallionellaceae bacterium]|nr:hypothetical protein [Gallionellaceae bacterium]
MKTLSPGTAFTLEVDPCALFHPSGIEVTAGAHYQFEASGMWGDSKIKRGPEGWHGLIFQAWNRLPWRPFMLLCGSVGQDLQKSFPIGRTLEWRASSEVTGWPDRQLYFFANDWPSCYRNNHVLPPEEGGPLNVSITRLK